MLLPSFSLSVTCGDSSPKGGAKRIPSNTCIGAFLPLPSGEVAARSADGEGDANGQCRPYIRFAGCIVNYSLSIVNSQLLLLFTIHFSFLADAIFPVPSSRVSAMSNRYCTP